MNTVTQTLQARIPLVDLQAQYVGLREQMQAVFEEVASKASFIKGPYVAAFERSFAEFCGMPHSVGVANGTEALFLALKAVGLKPGDEVITVPNTFTATAEAIEHAGGRVRFVDVDPADHLLAPATLEAAIGPNTAGILPVHLFGQPADMPAIQAIAERHGLFVVEDAAQAHGATLDGQPVGSFSQVACYSFYPGKNLGAYGDAGAVTTRDAVLDRVMRSLGDHGRTSKYEHDSVGFGMRLDALQAAILSIKLRSLPEWTRQRQALAARYDQLLADVPGVEPVRQRPGAASVYHLYVIEVDPADRDPLIAWLDERGISTGIHYPIPLHLQEAYRHLGYRAGDFPVAEEKARRILSLPIYPELTAEQQDRIVETIRGYVDRR
jgi:dTDP-4-amino-4,6-dideoxygalactose transaminase